MEDAQQKILTSSRVLSTKIDAFVSNIVEKVTILSTDPRVVNYNNISPKSQESVLEMYQAIVDTNPNIKYCYSGYLDGTLVINNYTPPNNYIPSQRPWYQSAEDSFPGLSIGLPYQDINTKEWLISISKVLVNEDGEHIGVLAIDCSFDSIMELMNESKYFTSQVNYIIDVTNHVIVHQNEAYLGKSINEISEGSSKLLSEKANLITYKIGNERRKAYYNKLDSVNWTIVSAIDFDEIAKPIVSKVFVTTLLLFIVSIVLGLIQVVIYEQRLVKPLSRLSKRVSDITKGHVIEAANSKFTNAEIRRIAKDIESMTESSLSRKTTELKLILESTSDCILVLDKYNQIVHYNKRFLELWGLEPSIQYKSSFEFPFETMAMLIVNEDQTSFDFNHALRKSEETWNVIEFKSGRHIEVVSRPLIHDEHLSGRLWNYRDITETKKDQERLTYLATTDDLTGLGNRRYFLERGKAEIELAKRYQLKLSLIQMDIDYFKLINDTYGHGAGDEGLKYVANVLKTHLRESDIIGRIGGEEFCILVQNVEKHQVYALCEKIRHYFQDHTFIYEEKPLRFTISIGIAFYENNIDSMETYLKLADDACYKAKAAGRNTIYPIL